MTIQQFISHFKSLSLDFDEALTTHLSDNHELLPHVLMGDWTRSVLALQARQGVGHEEVQAALQTLEMAMAQGSSDLQELVVVSFLENLDPGTPELAELRKSFGPALAQAMNVFENWRP
ncbi:MAG TPA: hypothetical protein PLF40_06830 [Kofleriaceae bacterium]|nr:hypothetical protein [Kofleriaceae bacterium]